MRSEKGMATNPAVEAVASSRINWMVGGLFIVGQNAGAGIVALPTALNQTGFVIGIVLLAVVTFVTALTSSLLGRCWCMLLEAWPDYKEQHTRRPYAEIGSRAYGPKMVHIVNTAVYITQFGGSVVYTLISSKNIQNIFKAFFGVDIPYCVIIFALAIFILPVILLKSPKDFWWAVVTALVTTTVAVTLMVIGYSMDFAECQVTHHFPTFRFGNFFLGFGTLLFSFGGHATFPTIQHDMRKPADFTKSTLLAFTITIGLYAPTAIGGVLAYGDSVRDEIMSSIQSTSIQQLINLLITVHLILALTIMTNPLNQAVEDIVDIPHEFCWQRVAVRASVLFVIAFVAASVPSFGPLLNLVGGSSQALTAVILPCLFFLSISAQVKNGENVKAATTDSTKAGLGQLIRNNSTLSLAVCSAVIAFGVVGGIAATVSAIRDLSTAHFEPPCYLALFDGAQELSPTSAVSHTNCCGAFQNITTHAGVVCRPADTSFYTR